MLEYELCMYVNHHRSKLNSTSQKFKLYYISKQGFQAFHKTANEWHSWLKQLRTFEINNIQLWFILQMYHRQEYVATIATNI